MKKLAIAVALGSLMSVSLASCASSVVVPEVQYVTTQPEAAANMSVEYAEMVAQQAYVWGWPLMNQKVRKETINQAPRPLLMNGIMPVTPQGQLGMLSDYINPGVTFVACPNQDVVYGIGFFSLDEQPVIIQVPDFGDRFWVYAMYDNRTDQFGQLGRQYNTKPGHYMIVGPNWEGEVPEGIVEVIRAPTKFANVIPRIFKDDTPEDLVAIQPLINQIMAYPVEEFDNTIRTTAWKDLPVFEAPKSKGERKWVHPETFFDKFGQLLADVPPLPGEEAMYANFESLLASAAANPEIKKVLTETAIKTEKDIISTFFNWSTNGVDAGNGWNRSKNNANFGLDYYMRASTARSNMFENRPEETQYFYTDNDTNKIKLDGKDSYTVTFAKGELPPVNGFWSLTMYNERHLFTQNDIGRYSLGTKSKSMKLNDDGSLTVYISNKEADKENFENWLPAPEGEFSIYIRAYWPKEEILDGSWKPPVIVKNK